MTEISSERFSQEIIVKIGIINYFNISSLLLIISYAVSGIVVQNIQYTKGAKSKPAILFISKRTIETIEEL
jgi:hypothetical protein